MKMSKQVKPSTNPKHDYAFASAFEGVLMAMRLSSLEKKEKDDCYCDAISKIGGTCFCCSIDNDDSPYSLKF
jgi:hypothetical protein